MTKKYRAGGFQTRVHIDVEETSAPMLFWPGDIRSQFKSLVEAGAASEHSALAWYRWRYADACWQSILYLPEESTAIVALGKDSTAIVADVGSPEEALRRLVDSKGMPNPVGCGCQRSFP